jgi:hypothetical protein
MAQLCGESRRNALVLVRDRIERLGFKGRCMCGWGTAEQMVEGRDYLMKWAMEASVT